MHVKKETKRDENHFYGQVLQNQHILESDHSYKCEKYEK